MKSSREYERRRQAEHDAAVGAGKDPDGYDFKRNDQGEILCSVVANTAGCYDAGVREKTKQLLERHHVEKFEAYIRPITISFEVPESEVEPLMTALRKLGCDKIEAMIPKTSMLAQRVERERKTNDHQST
jgi:ABC-type sulfate transport system substrate-binding protein